MNSSPLSRRRERGITMLGALILIVFIGLFVYAGLRLTPLYLEYMNVSKALNRLAAQVDSSATPDQLRRAIEKQFDIDDVKSLDWHDIELTKAGGTWTVHAAYDARAPYISNVGFTVHFEKTVTVGPSGGP